MRRFVNSFGTRTIAFFLAVGSATACLASAVVFLFLWNIGVYYDSGVLTEHALQIALLDKNVEVRDRYENYLSGEEYAYGTPFEQTGEFRESFAEEVTNYFFTVTDENGEELFRSYSDRSQASMSADFFITMHSGEDLLIETQRFATEEECATYVDENFLDDPNIRVESYDWEASEEGTPAYLCTVSYYRDEVQKITVAGSIRSELTVRDEIYESVNTAKILTEWSTVVLYVLPVSAVITILLTVLLCCGAGRKNGVDGVYLTRIERLPMDLVAAVHAVLSVLMIAAIAEVWDLGLYFRWYHGAFALAALAVLSVCVLWLITVFAAQVKAGKWWRRTVVAAVLRLLKRVALKLLSAGRLLVKWMPLYWKAAVIYVGVMVVELFLFALCDDLASWLTLWVLEKVIVGGLLAVVLVFLRRLQRGAEEISNGNLSYQINLEHMPPTLREHGERLNSIRDGLSKEVDERMKSERMKTELITNVSHDIKTPLTSIVNYVDLLKAEPVGSERAQEYFEVLERQSARLKKLITDLVEASKASTGNLSANMEPTDMNVLLSQTVGEYENKLAERSLELVQESDGNRSLVMADGRLLWRVFDNLLNNICKYALSGTRVYLTSAVANGTVTVTFKNISSCRLNVPSDELMERFVRGDRSRNTEGSGLGLSIAKSLVELQKGRFDVVIDGDLFKAIVVFDLLPPTE